ncbi:MAG: OFA family MFS transporter [Armatimonadota bacterium]|nr:OFA family MFS transporter [bacterium]MDW8321831.1 OFA family MFS transporter [Armatimonadota bacterium]
MYLKSLEGGKMMGKPVLNRWWVLVGALMIQVSLGAVYIYSVFKPALKERFPHWSDTDLALPSQLVLACFAFSMPFFGRLQDRFGPRLVAMIGGVLLGLGLISASFASSLTHFVLSYAVIGGIGIGAAYVCPIATCVKWFPDMRGVITGLAVAGFGAGALVFTPVARHLIATQGVMPTFLYLGVIFLTTVLLGAQVMVNPPPGYTPGKGAVKSTASPSDVPSLTLQQAVRTWKFWLLWFTYFTGCTAGLMIIMNSMNIWQSFAVGAVEQTPIAHTTFAAILAQGATAVIVVSILNAVGRVAWGKVSDLLGRRTALCLMFLFAGVVMLSLHFLRSYPQFLVGVACIGFCFGGFLAVYPAVTADLFGTRHIGAIYGAMFSAYGAGGLLGPWLAPRLMQVVERVPYEVLERGNNIAVRTFEVGSYTPAFAVSGILCLISAALMLGLRVTAPAPGAGGEETAPALVQTGDQKVPTAR